MTYLVLGQRPWARWAFEQMRDWPGVWQYCAEVENVPVVVEQLQPAKIFVLHWSAKVPAEIVKQYECINFHIGNLPDGRGGSPLQNLIVRGIRQTELCALRMTEEFDAGPVYLRVPVSLEGTAEEVYLRAMGKAVGMCWRIVQDKPEPVPQEGKGRVFARRTPEQSRIPAVETREQLYDHLRMLDAEGYPHAFLEHQGCRYEFCRVTLTTAGIRAEVLIT